jgi:hypothetical protein
MQLALRAAEKIATCMGAFRTPGAADCKLRGFSMKQRRGLRWYADSLGSGYRSVVLEVYFGFHSWAADRL